MGVQTKPHFGNDVELIPTFVFRGKPDINWNSNTVNNFGKQFETVEIRDRNSDRSKKSISQPRPKRPGRPRVDALIKEAVLKLKAAGQFAGKSQKQKIVLVQQLAQHEHPREFPRKTQPSPTKVREALCSGGE
jgi:hypothetical protein